MQLSAAEIPQPSNVTQFLKFNLSADLTALLSISQLAAVLKVETAAITAMPHLPPWVMGVYNWRGEILWIVDTGHLLGEGAWYQQPILSTKHDVLLLESLSTETVDKCRLGLWVRQVEGIESLSLDVIQSPTTVSEKLVPFLRGYWLSANDEMLALLDGSAIFDRMPV